MTAVIMALPFTYYFSTVIMALPFTCCFDSFQSWGILPVIQAPADTIMMSCAVPIVEAGAADEERIPPPHP